MGSSDIKSQQGEFSEKRTSPRSPVYIDVNYSIAGRVRTDFIRNISNEGAFIETRKPFSHKQDIIMTFRHPSSQDHLKVGGNVVRIDQQGAGIKFLKSQQIVDNNRKKPIERRRNLTSLEADCARLLSAVHGRLLREQVRDKYGEKVFAREFQQALQAAAEEIRQRRGIPQSEALEAMQRAAKKIAQEGDAGLKPPEKAVGIRPPDKITLPRTVDDKYLHHNFGPRPRKVDFGPGAEFYESAAQLFNSKDYKRAAPLFKIAIDMGLEPEIMATAYCRLGVIAAKEKDIRAAIENFLKCLEAPFRIDTDVFLAAANLRIIFTAANHAAGAEKFDRLCRAAKADRPDTGSGADRSKAFRPFQEAREFVGSLGLKNKNEWTRFCKGQVPDKGGLPKDIPPNPWLVYKDKGWTSMGGWLGTGTIAPRSRKYRSFKQAREFARGLGLRSQSEWRKFCKGEMPEKGPLPEDVPAVPRQVYRDKGWASMGDWLGTGRIADQFKKFGPFQEARKFARSLRLKNINEWRKFCKGEMPGKGSLPDHIPANPRRIYRDKGWAGMGDWLGTGTIALRLRKYRSFEGAREFVRSLGLKSDNEWRRFCKGQMPDKGMLPGDIPADPRQVYKDKGWTSIGDWLGTGAIARRLRKYRSFEQAREFAQGLGLKSQSEWRRFCKGEMPEKGTLPKDIPVAAWQIYKDKGWSGMGDWLGKVKEKGPFLDGSSLGR